jgi:hypothetical protein
MRLALLSLLVLVGGCAQPQLSKIDGPAAPVSVASRPLAHPAQPCTGAFVAHTLDHTTTTGQQPVRLYESNGTGLALGDLDDDGDLDIVLANLAGPNAILWNEGGLRFRREELPFGRSRAVAAVDVDGDGRLDLVFTRQFARPSLLRNTGNPGARFVEADLPGVFNPLYAQTWADIDGDGDLDLIAGSYDGELLKREGQIFEQRGGGVGIFVYEREGETFTQQRLASKADALAIALPDLDGDGRRDIWVGNDFNTPDAVFLQRGDGTWEPVMPSDHISENTMSLDLGDIDNDGTQELFATDMKPMAKDPATLAQWLPMMDLVSKTLTSADPQHPENTLQVRGADGRWHNQAYERMIDSSGWSWSGKFGDLDRDGWLDLYIVNGMIAAGLFDHLPGQALVEPNVAFHNQGGVFRPAPEWRLGSTASGRGMSMADLDGDGDLDIVVNNLESPAQLFENRLCGGGSLLVELRQPGGNTRAIGAILRLHTSAGIFTRDVRATSGYLSGDAPQVHFGIPHSAEIERLEVQWPDGAVSRVDTIAAGSDVVITRR